MASTARTIAEMLREGGLYFAARLLSLGRTGRRLLDEIARRFPDSFHQSRHALADRARAGREAARRYNLGGSGYRVPRGVIPCNPQIDRNVRVHVDIEFLNPDTGSYQHFGLRLAFDGVPSNSEVEAEIDRRLAAIPQSRSETPIESIERVPSAGAARRTSVRFVERSC